MASLTVADDPDYIDDDSIPSTAVVWRRIPRWHYKFDDNQKDYRPSTASFEDDKDGDPMSAYLAIECSEPGVALEGHEGFGLVAFPVSVVRARGMKIVRKPTNGPPGHVLIVGKKTDSIKRALKRNSDWIVRPTIDPETAG